MALPVIFFRGSEDIDYNFTGATGVSAGGRYRAGYARCSIEPGGSGGLATNKKAWNGGSGAPAGAAWWFSAQVMTQNTAQNGITLLTFYDTASVIRFFIAPTGTNTFSFNKRTAAGVVTNLGGMNFGVAAGSLYKLDIQVIDAVAGTVNIYINQVLIFTFSGDTTTDGSGHAIAFHSLGNTLSGNAQYDWSEIIASDSDTRNMSSVTLAPVANGNTHNFNIGSPAAANVNEIVNNDTTIDGSDTAGQIDQYTIGALPSGTFSILDFGISARMTCGFSGPTKMDLGVRSGASPADFWSPDNVLTHAMDTYIYDWATDPSTSAAWASLPANIGLKSVA